MSSVLLTRLEAVELSGVSPTTVKKAVDQKVIPTRRRRSHSYIDADDVGALVMFEALAGMRLRVKQKVQVRRWLRSSPEASELALTDALVVRKVSAVDQARERARRYVQLRDAWIVRDPDVKGGEPVIKGSRVGVHTLAARIANGESAAVLDEDFPHIPADAREVAVQYARANPRRGRPPRVADAG
jgi:uncharacterized protein (DUF433 family)